MSDRAKQLRAELLRRELAKRQSSPSAPTPTTTAPAAPVESQPEGAHWGHKAGAVIDGLAQGMTFGLSDEIAAGLQTGGGFLGDYDKALADERARMAENREKAGLGYQMAGEIPGAIATGGGLLKAGLSLAPRVAGRALPARVAAGAAEGAAYGAAYGAGTAEGGIESRIKGAGSGALTGGGVGAAAPIVGAGIRAGAGAASNAVKESVGGLIDPAKRAAQKVQKAIAIDRAAGSGISRAQEAVAAKTGQPLMNFDRGGETVRALARAAANQNPSARETASKAVSDRFANQGPRVKNFIDHLMGGSVDDVATQESVRQAARAANAPAYDRAYKFNFGQQFPSDKLQSLVARVPAKAVTNARNIAKAEGRPFGEQLVATIDDASNTVKFTRMPSMRELDYIQRGLRATADKSFRSGAGNVGTAYSNLHKELLQEMDAVNPLFQQARRGAAAFFDAEDALEAGQKFVTQNRKNEEVAKVLSKMNRAERDAFAIGFAGELKKAVKQSGDRTNVINRVFGSEQSREKIELALGPKRYKEMEAFIKVENLMDLARTTFSNSTTARQLVELGLAGGAGGATYLGTGDLTQAAVVAGVVRGGRSLANRSNEKTMKAIADLLVQNNPAAMRKLAANARLSKRYMAAIEQLSAKLEQRAMVAGASQAE